MENPVNPEISNCDGMADYWRRRCVAQNDMLAEIASIAARRDRLVATQATDGPPTCQCDGLAADDDGPCATCGRDGGAQAVAVVCLPPPTHGEMRAAYERTIRDQLLEIARLRAVLASIEDRRLRGPRRNDVAEPPPVAASERSAGAR